MELSLDLRGFDALSKSNARFMKEAGKAVKNSLSRTLRRTATGVKRDIRGTGIGRSIWGRNAANLGKFVGIIRPRPTADSIETGLKFKGIPKLMEDGGRIKAHKIKGKTAKGRLVFEGRHGIVVTQSVQHPGGAVHRHGFGGSALRRNERMIGDDLMASIERVKQWAYGQAGGQFEVNF